MSGVEVLLRRDCLDYILIAHTWHTVLMGSHSQLLPYVWWFLFFRQASCCGIVSSNGI
jgi:hypothetical protein